MTEALQKFARRFCILCGEEVCQGCPECSAAVNVGEPQQLCAKAGHCAPHTSYAIHCDCVEFLDGAEDVVASVDGHFAVVEVPGKPPQEWP